MSAVTYAELAARLLRDAATFFNTLGSQNPDLQQEMARNVMLYNGVADFVDQGETGDAAPLLRGAAAIFRVVGEQNPPLAEQMRESATVFEQVADLIEADPKGSIEQIS
jgi:hypothetical protein